MSDLEIRTRREFLKRALGIGVGTLVTGTMVGSTVSSIGSLLAKDSGVDPTPTYENKEPPGLILNKSIENLPFKLYGIIHTRSFKEANYNTIEQLIKNSSMVVSEGTPEDLKKSTASFNAYFGTVVDLCQKYTKPIISLDSQSKEGTLLEFGIGTAGLGYGGYHSFKMITKDSDRRQFFKELAKTSAGFYLFMGSLFNSVVLKALYFSLNDSEDPIGELLKAEKYYLGHIIDQRNVQITNRLLELPNLLDEKDFQNGEYVLVKFGSAHILGVDYYLDHPTMRKAKSGIYSFNYDLVDSDEIAKFVPEGKSWKKVVLKS